MISIALDADADLAAHARLGGRDIVFTLGDGTTRIPFELVALEPVTGGLDAWARVPELAAGESHLFMYYGAGIQVTQSPWPAAYLGVWHMTGAMPGRETDSIGRVSDLVPSAAIETPAIATGVAGNARDYTLGPDAGSGSELCTATNQMTVGTGSFTYSMWLYNRSIVGDYDSPFVHGGTDVTNIGFDVELGANSWVAELSDGVSHVQGLQIGSPILNEWLFLTVVVDRDTPPGTVRIYKNGVQALSQPLVAGMGALSNTAMRTLCIGSAAYRFDGLIDEVWVRTGAWGADAILAHYQNLADRVGFLSVGLEQSSP